MIELEWKRNKYLFIKIHEYKKKWLEFFLYIEGKAREKLPFKD